MCDIIFNLGKYSSFWDKKLSDERRVMLLEQANMLSYQKRLIDYESKQTRFMYTRSDSHTKFIDTELENIWRTRLPWGAYTGRGTCKPVRDAIFMSSDYDEKIEFILTAIKGGYESYPDCNTSDDPFIQSIIDQRLSLIRTYTMDKTGENDYTEIEEDDQALKSKHNKEEYELACKRETLRRSQLKRVKRISA